MTELHPDAALLALCAQLAAMQAEWQRLWEATAAHRRGGRADKALDEFSEYVWPGTQLSNTARLPGGAVDLPARLLTLPATKPEGLQAKAAAVLAISDAGAYSGRCRDDEVYLMISVVREAAGSAYRPLGEDAA